MAAPAPDRSRSQDTLVEHQDRSRTRVRSPVSVVFSWTNSCQLVLMTFMVVCLPEWNIHARPAHAGVYTYSYMYTVQCERNLDKQLRVKRFSAHPNFLPELRACIRRNTKEYTTGA